LFDAVCVGDALLGVGGPADPADIPELMVSCGEVTAINGVEGSAKLRPRPAVATAPYQQIATHSTITLSLCAIIMATTKKVTSW
jgi:hypothetical protein